MPAVVRDNPTRQDTWIINVSLKVGNVNHALGIWDKKSGGDVDSDEVKYYPGAMGPPISLGGRKTVSNVLVDREYDRIDDHSKIAMLLNAVGKGIVTVSQRPLDLDGNPNNAKAITYQGILKKVVVPPADSEATGPCLVQLEITITGYPAVV